MIAPALIDLTPHISHHCLSKMWLRVKVFETITYLLQQQGHQPFNPIYTPLLVPILGVSLVLYLAFVLALVPDSIIP